MAVFYPNSKHGPGCASPFEYQAKLIDGLSGMSGGCEILWQLANFNFEEWCKGCVTPEFGHYAASRAWRFEYDEKLPEHGCKALVYGDAQRLEIAHFIVKSGDEFTIGNG